MSFKYLLRNALHAEDLDTGVFAVLECVGDESEILLVHLAQVHTEAARCVEAAATAFALEVLSLLVPDEDLEIVEILLTVVAPWTGEHELEVWGISLLLRHGGGGLFLLCLV